MKPYLLGILIFIGGFLALWKFIDNTKKTKWLVLAAILVIASIIMFQSF